MAALLHCAQLEPSHAQQRFTVIAARARALRAFQHAPHVVTSLRPSAVVFGLTALRHSRVAASRVAAQIQTAAIRNAFDDLNADFRAGRVTPQSSFLPYPLHPQIYASAFASATFEGDATPGEYLGGPTVRNAHNTFGLGPNGQFFYFNASVQNMDAYSVVRLAGDPGCPLAACHPPNTLMDSAPVGTTKMGTTRMGTTRVAR